MSQWIKKLPLPPIYLSLLLLGLYFAVYQSNWLSLLIFTALLARLIWLYPAKIWQVSFCFLLPFLTFFLFQKIKSEQDFQHQPQELKTIVIILDTIKINGDSLSFRGKANGQVYQAYYQLKSEQEKEAFQNLSDLTELTIKGALDLAEEQRNFAGFDYRAYLKSQRIYRVLKIDSIQSSKLFTSVNPFDWLAIWRRKALVYVRQHFPSPMNHYMTGLLFAYLDTNFEEMNDLYSSLGIIHLFALSGMQVGFFVEHFRKFLLRLGLSREVVAYCQLPFSLIYAALTGFSVSVVRSLLQKWLAQKGLSRLDNFAVTMMVLALLLPNFLLTVGGLLSCAYAFIIAMLDFEHLPKRRRILAESLTISLGILPLLIFCFAEFQPWSVLLTFFFSLIFDFALLPLLSLIFLFSPLFTIKQVNFLFLVLENMVRWAASIFPRPLVFGKPSPFILLLMLLTLALLYDFRRRKKIVLSLSALVLFLFFWTKFPLQNEITMIDIGQGDSIFLRDWRGRTVLIDVGGRVDFAKKEKWQERVTSSNASKTLLPYLKSRGVDSIDALVLTHTDTDHVGDLLEVAKSLSIKKIYVSKGSLTQKDFVKTLAKIPSPVHLVQVGDSLPIFDGQLEVLYPSEMGDGGNDDSIVLYGKFFQTSFLFTGDLEKEGEQTLMRHFPDLNIDVLKAGHHGSKGSSSPEFLEQLSPKIALISAGKNNRYHHPHAETLARFEQIASHIYRTDQEGAIRFTGWQSWQLETVR